MTADRRSELAANLAAVHQRIERAATAAGRDPGEITLVAVTKTRPASDLEHLAALGVQHVGENREQEADAKHAAVAVPLVWHFIGRLQTNKARAVARWADVVESVDRIALVEPLARGAAAAGRRLAVLLQVSLDGDPERGGVPVNQLDELAAEVVAHDALELRGVMAVAPLGVDPALAFADLARVHESLLALHPDAVVRSAGMSGDLEQAVAAGATHLRVGTALLGARPPIVR